MNRVKAANAPVRDHISLILDASRTDGWMNPVALNPAALSALLRPAPKDWLATSRVSPLVNNVKNEGPR